MRHVRRDGLARQAIHGARAGAIRVACVVSAAVVLGCPSYERTIGPVAMLEGVVEAGEGVYLTNEDDEAVYFLAVAAEYGLTSTFGFTPCTDPESCPAIVPGATHLVPFDELLGYAPSTREVAVYHWLLRPAPDGEHVAVGVDVLLLRIPPAPPS